MCHDSNLPLWLRRKRHLVLDLDETIAYDDDESPVLDVLDSIPKTIAPDSKSVPYVPDFDSVPDVPDLDFLPDPSPDLAVSVPDPVPGPVIDAHDLDCDSELSDRESDTDPVPGPDAPVPYDSLPEVSDLLDYNLTDDVPEYHLQMLFDRPPIIQPPVVQPPIVQHVHASLPTTRSGRVRKVPKYLLDYSQ